MQSFPEYKIVLSCPCALKRDSALDKEEKQKINVNSVSYFCTDANNSDKYHLSILLKKNIEYPPEKILEAIDSALISKNVQHERKIFLNTQAMIIDYGRAKELELLPNDYMSYYLVVEATDSLDSKFNKWINSIELK